ncbi:MAG: response regulator [Candidatus Methylomirabilales bacterium]
MHAQHTVIVIDDDPRVRERYRRLLEMDRCRVVEAGNGAEALVWFLGETADVIILDLGMPVVDGRSFLEYRARLARVRAIPVLVLTGLFDDGGLRETLLRLGADRVLQKPVRRQALHHAVRELLARSRPSPPLPPQGAPKAGGRQDARVAFSVPIRVCTPAAADTSGRLTDLSAGGLGAYLPHRLYHGDRITVSLDIRGHSLALLGIVQWADEGRTARGYRHGIRFAERQEETFPLCAYSFLREHRGTRSPLARS